MISLALNNITLEPSETAFFTFGKEGTYWGARAKNDLK